MSVGGGDACFTTKGGGSAGDGGGGGVFSGGLVECLGFEKLNGDSQSGILGTTQITEFKLPQD